MKLVVDNPLFGLLLDHKLEPNTSFEEIGAFLIIGSTVNSMPEFRLVHANRIHDHVGEDVCDVLTDVTSSSTTIMLVRVSHLGGLLVDFLNDLNSKMFMIKLKAFVCVISVV